MITRIHQDQIMDYLGNHGNPCSILMPKLSVHLVTWNGSKYIPYLFGSLRKQTFQDWKLYILDNASTDDTVERMKKELVDSASSADRFPVPYELVESKENIWFSLMQMSKFRPHF